MGKKKLLYLLLFVMLFLPLNYVAGQVFLISIRAEGSTDVCQGNAVTAVLSVFGGSPPYTVTINDNDGEYTVLQDINMPYQFEIYPQTDNTYYISEALDSKDRKGRAYGSVEVTVTPAPPVNIILDRTAYLESEGGVQLESDPSGGVFTGPGVSRSTFYPAVATTEGSPHLITCTYTTNEGCVSTDTELLYVLSGECSVALYDGDVPVTTFCSDGSNYTLRGSNQDGLNGTFELFRAGTSNPVTGHISDADPNDNMATLLTAGLSGDYEVVYHYGIGGLSVKTSSEFTALVGGATGIVNFPENVCKNDDPYPLVPEVVTEDPGATYTFSGDGVSGNQSDGFYFDPGDQEVSAGQVEIALDYTSSNGCHTELIQDVNVGVNPEPGFTLSPVCIPLQGGTVSFENQTPLKNGIQSWNWNFGDPGSGSDNTSNAENPDHFYSEPGSKTVSLTATTAEGCQGSTQLDTLLVDVPSVDFTFSSDCYAADQAILFDASVGSVHSGLDTLIWSFRLENGSLVDEIGNAPSETTLEYTFPSLDNYEVSLQLQNEAGCIGDISKPVELVPLEVVEAGGYEEHFDQPVAEWNVASADGLESWVLGVPDFSGFDPVSGDRAWYTDLKNYDQGTVEHSWVNTPCFDLSGLRNPVIEMDIMKSFDPGKGGAVLQYREGMDHSWTTLGYLDEENNWYNQSGLQYMPGGSSTGWGLSTFEPDEQWVPASQPFEVLTGHPHIKFRIAIATGGREEQAPGVYNQGFAFDNFSIRESMRRRSVLEYFTNTAGESIFAADSMVNTYSIRHRGLVYDLHYHMNYPNDDPMNANNPFPPSTRAFNLGIPMVPYAVLNGGTVPDERFDLSVPEVELGEEVLKGAASEPPLFDLLLSVDFQENRLEGTVNVLSLTDTFNTYLQLYVVVLEEEVSSYPELAQDSVFRNVVLDILPSPSGTLLGNQWTIGTEVENTFSWEYPYYLEDASDLMVVAFVQDRNQGGILQAEAQYQSPATGTSEIKTESGSLTLYPNPSSGQLTVSFGNHPVQRGSLMVVDISGREVMVSEVPEGSLLRELDISRLAEGAYMLFWKESGFVKGHAPFIRIR
ncbi:MAG: PKD domain-containing protein [Bacteroidales bacterium]